MATYFFPGPDGNPDGCGAAELGYQRKNGIFPKADGMSGSNIEMWGGVDIRPAPS